jgi:hypothetical protein
MSIEEITRPDPLAKARAVKAANRAARAAQSEVESCDPSPFDIIAELKAELAALKAERSAPMIEAPPRFERAMVAGLKLSPANRIKLQEMADIIPTNPDEYRLQANAATRLKLAQAGVWVEVVATRRGRFLRNEQVAPSKYREVVDYTAPDTLAISGDDLAKIAPGGIGQKFRIGEKALVTQDAAERLIAMGFVELA